MKPSLLLGVGTHQDVLQLLRAHRTLTVSGLSNETAKSVILGQFFEMEPFRATLITSDQGRAETLHKWLSFFGVPAAVYPEEGEEEQFAAFLHFYTSSEPGIFILSEKSSHAAFPSLADIAEHRILFERGQTVQFTELFEKLIACGYTHGSDVYLRPGEYRKIGDVLDIFPMQSLHPFKIDFSFETIGTIRSVDRYDAGKTEMHEGELCVYPTKCGKSESLTAQLPHDSFLLLDDQDEERASLRNPTLFFTAFPQSEEDHIHLRYLSVLKFYTLTDFLNDVRDKLSQDWRLIVVTKRAEELRQILLEERVSFTSGEEVRMGALTILEAKGDVLPHSLQNPDRKCALLTDREIFSLRKEGKQRSIQKLALDFITSLQPGDFVVHMDHGIGRFERITQKSIDEVPREYLELQYAGTDKLFTPIDQADKLSKFVHEEGEEPELSKLGSSDWKRTSEKMKSETKKIAKELLGLYARRAKARGYAFGPDNEEQKRFETAFEYTETPGQIKAIQDIKFDMEDGHPMDRLICGDVGFGKTEVAMRAAFKSVQNGKQVAVVSPITILADQHFQTFTKRMGGFGVRIEMLSRFRTRAEQTDILRRLRKGDIDVIIGTHRLLQEDVQFFNLGLLVIDEEQRFGVKQKEKLKSLRASVDILTLTATPIPRTLNLGLHKLRDITTITTPPPGRLPIITEVRKYSDALVRQAIMKEVERKGQVYVLHNRVETIDAFADKLRKLIPEATFIVSHGQLKPDDLEKRVFDFKEGKYDVLVSSTIIENGIDLPRANTLVVNEAERFGISQLYQLRGRVGRAKIQAYAYFLYHTQKLKDDAKKRLRAIVEASELGSGFQISMRDLEIRGAGEILGGNQSGHMKTVGVSHFLRLLKQAVEEMRGEGKVEELMEQENVEINLPVEALIPPFYIPDEQEKISVYQKLAGSESEAILAEFREDLVDEYGQPPRQVENLFSVLRLKMACRRSGVIRVKAETHRTSKGDTHDFVLTLSPRVTAEQIIPLISGNAAWKISGSTLRIDQANLGDEWMERLRESAELLTPKKTAIKKMEDVQEAGEAA